MDETVNRSWLFCTAAAGVVLVLLAVAADVWWGLDNIVPSAFLEMGAAALMAAVLFLVVPHFTAGVAEAVSGPDGCRWCPTCHRRHAG